MTRDRRWLAEYTPEGEQAPRSFVVDYSYDDQFILNACAWLREMWGNSGTVRVRCQRLLPSGWVTESDEEYTLLASDPHGPFALASPDADIEGRTHSVDPDTSRAAARVVKLRSGTMRARCLEAVGASGDHGCTWDELEVQLGMYSAQKRVSELKLGGWIAPSGERRETRRGAPAEVYVVTPLGAEWLAGIAAAA